MPKRRNSRKPTTSDTAHHQPLTHLRQSPRFLDQNSQDSDTYNPRPTKAHKDGTQKASKKPREPCQISSLCAIPDLGSRRCPRFSKSVDRFSSPRQSLRPQVIDKSNHFEKPTTSATAYPEPLISHRRSPRFLHQNPQDLNTLRPKPTEDHKDGTQKASKKPRKPDQISSLGAIAILGSRRSPRFSKRVDGFPNLRQPLKAQVVDKSNHLDSKEDRKRSSSPVIKKYRDNIDKSNHFQSKKDNKRSSSPVIKKCRSNIGDELNKAEGEVGVVIGLRAQRRGDGIERREEGRVSRKRKRGEEEVERNASRRSLRLQVIEKSNHLELKKKEDTKTSSGPVIKKCRDNKADLLNKFEGEVGVVIGLRVRRGGDGIKRSEKGRVSRKLKRGEEEVERIASVKGWTREQEIALQRAYFAAKPTPNFWKKVSKLVPGKSAQDCFDKVHSCLATPPQPLPRSRVKKTNISPLRSLSLSAGKLLSSSGLNFKRLSHNKQKNHMAHKTVRQLLQNHNRIDQSNEADLFSILEPNVNLSGQDSQLKDVSTPKHLQEKLGFLQKWHERSSSSQKNPLSRFGSSCGTELVSPPVLKQVKNWALHEKYIDQLHCREAKRKAACARSGKENNGKFNMQKIDMIRAAKIALVSDARDAINKLQHLQTNAKGDSSDFDDDGVDSNDNDEVDGF